LQGLRAFLGALKALTDTRFSFSCRISLNLLSV
jgi:hypothetical protein